MSTLSSRVDRLLSPVFHLIERTAAPALRLGLGFILLWIGALKFHDASPVVGLIHASPFATLASATFVHVLGALEILTALLLFGGVALRYAGLLAILLFASTLTIFLTTPAVTGIPYLTLAGQFLLKDLVLAAASLAVVATDVARHAEARPEPLAMPSTGSRAHVA